MDYIYVPKAPRELTPEEVVALCDLRIDIFDRVVDRALNRRIVACMAECVRQQAGDSPPANTKVLDFGCGTGLASTFFTEAWRLPCETTGVDLSLRAIELAGTSGLDVRLVRTGEPLPFATATFDVAIACFVLHFKIDANSVNEIRRVLRTDGIFAFNLYNTLPDGLWDSLARAGFVVCRSPARCDLPGTHRVWWARPR